MFYDFRKSALWVYQCFNNFQIDMNHRGHLYGVKTVETVIHFIYHVYDLLWKYRITFEHICIL